MLADYICICNSYILFVFRMISIILISNFVNCTFMGTFLAGD